MALNRIIESARDKLVRDFVRRVGEVACNQKVMQEWRKRVDDTVKP